MNDDVCVWVKSIIVGFILEAAYSPTCPGSEKLISMGAGWIYCPWCGKKIEVRK